MLPGSISQTLPAYTGLSVSCYLSTLTDPTSATIICNNVGKMYASIRYTIGCRITFPYDLFTSPLEPNFGTITLYSVKQPKSSQPFSYSPKLESIFFFFFVSKIDPDTGLLQGEALSVSKNPISVVATDNNPNWALSTTNLDYTVFSTAGLTETVNSADLTTLGAIPTTSSGSL